MVENSAQPTLRHWVILSTLLAVLAVQLIGGITLHPSWLPSLAASRFRNVVPLLMSVSGSVIILQTAVIAQWHWPARPRWHFIGPMIVVGAITSKLPLIIHYLGITDANMPKLTAISVVMASIQIVTCIILLKYIACSCRCWLIPNSLDQSNLIQRLTPTQWSVRDLMLLTLVVAVAIMAGQSLNWSEFDGGLILEQFVLALNSVCAGCVAGYYSSGGTRRMVAFGGMNALILLGATFFTLKYLDHPTAFPNGIWMPVVLHIPHAILTVLFHLWIFHRWKRAGFGLIGWTRGNGFSRGSLLRNLDAC